MAHRKSGLKPARAPSAFYQQPIIIQDDEMIGHPSPDVSGDPPANVDTPSRPGAAAKKMTREYLDVEYEPAHQYIASTYTVPDTILDTPTAKGVPKKRLKRSQNEIIYRVQDDECDRPPVKKRRQLPISVLSPPVCHDLRSPYAVEYKQQIATENHTIRVQALSTNLRAHAASPQRPFDHQRRCGRVGARSKRHRGWIKMRADMMEEEDRALGAKAQPITRNLDIAFPLTNGGVVGLSSAWDEKARRLANLRKFEGQDETFRERVALGRYLSSVGDDVFG